MKVIYFVINDISMPGGLARVTLNLYGQFISKYPDQYTVKILSATISDLDFSSNKDIINLGLPSLHSKNKLQKIFWYASLIRLLNKFFKSNSSDVVIGIATMMNLCICLLSKKIQVKRLYGTEHIAYEQHNKIVLFVRKILYKNLHRVISLTKVDASKYKENHLSVIDIPNFTTFFNGANKVTEYRNKSIISIGRLTHQKGYDNLLDFIKPFFIKNSDWVLIIIGEGSLLSSLNLKIKQLKLENNIYIKSPTKKVNLEYVKSSIYIMTSRFEGFPMVLLEAKSFGLPIVSFNCPTGPSEIVKDGEDGFLIPVEKSDLFLEKLQLLVDDQSLREKMGAKALINIKEFYPDKVMAKWVKILDE